MTIDLAPGDFDVVLRTFQTVFPYCLLWMAPNCINKQVVLVGSTEPWKINFNRIEESFQNHLIRKNLEAINIRSPYDLLDCIILDHRGIASISKNALLNTDNHPILEFSHRAIRSRDLCAYLNLGNTFISLHDFNQAIDAYQNAIVLNPKEPDYFNNLAMSYREAGNTEKALQIFREGLQIHAQSALLKKNYEDTKQRIK